MAHVVFVDTTSTGLLALETAKRLGHEVTFVKPASASFVSIMLSDPAKFAPFMRYADRVVEIESLGGELLHDALAEVWRRTPFDALITTSEAAIVPVAREAERFGTLYPSLAALSRAVFKDRLRTTLLDAGLRSPKFEVLSEARLAEGPAGVRPPFVIKPTRGFAKEFSAICRSWRDLADFAAGLRRGDGASAIDALVSREYIVEEYVAGTLHSAEVVVRDGVVSCFATTTRHRAHYYELLELAAVMPSGLSAPARAAIAGYLQNVFTALGIRVGLYHVELILCDGEPVLVEINARMMGSVSPIMYHLLSGTDPYELLIRLHLGEDVVVEADRFTGAGITLAVAARYGGRVRDDFDPGALRALLESYRIPHHTLNVYAGREIRRYEGNLSIMGHVIILDRDPSAVTATGLAFLREVERLVGMETAKYAASEDDAARDQGEREHGAENRDARKRSRDANGDTNNLR